MANKNDTSDIKFFFITAGGIFCFFVAIVVFSLVAIDKKFGTSIHFYEAELSHYIRQQWKAGANHKIKTLRYFAGYTPFCTHNTIKLDWCNTKLILPIWQDLFGLDSRREERSVSAAIR